MKSIRGAQKGDWRPVVFVLTDGQPTVDHDVWKAARDAIVERPKGQIKTSVIFAVGCGPNVIDDTLKAISTGTAFRMGTDATSFTELFKISLAKPNKFSAAGWGY